MSNHRGIALILTLWILAALIVLAAGIGVMARSEAQISRNYADLIRCRWAARAGVNGACAEVESLAKQQSTYLEGGDLTRNSEEQGLDLGEASFETVIEDEAGKVNINTAPVSVLEALFNSKDIADCVVDWRDEDDLAQPLGAETQYYSGLRMPYKAKNAPFDTVHELLLVKGITEKMLSAPATEDGRSLIDLLTVYSTDSNVAADGEQRVDIRSAGKDELKAGLGDVLSDQEIEAIIKRRSAGGFQSAAELIGVPGLSRDKVRRIFDRVTAADAKTRPGLININTAPIEVLAAVPGLDRASAEEIVDYRTANGPFDDVGQVLAVSGITEQAFEKSADYLTARSRVFAVESTGRTGRPGKEQASLAITCVLDASDGATQIKYWQEW